MGSETGEADYARSAIAPLLSTLEKLYPESSSVEVVRSSRHDRHGQLGRYGLIPNRSTPRLLIPLSSRSAAARSLMRFNAAMSLRGVGQRVAASAAVGLGATISVRDHVSVLGDPRDDSFRGFLRTTYGREVDFSLGVGTARANQKPILQIFGASGRCIGFAKLGDDPTAESHVISEELGLRAIEKALPEGIEAPRLIRADRWRGIYAVIMSAVETSPWQRPRDQWRLPVDAMLSLGRAYYEGSRPVEEIPAWRTMLDAVTRLEDPEAAESLTTSLERLSKVASHRRFDVGCWHGDWTPWNMARRRSRIQLWDWERFETGVPIGLDRFHYGVNAYTFRDGESLQSVLGGLTLAGADMGDRGSRDFSLAALYLAMISCRYALSSQGEKGELIAGRARLMARALDRWLTAE